MSMPATMCSGSKRQVTNTWPLPLAQQPNEQSLLLRRHSFPEQVSVFEQPVFSFATDCQPTQRAQSHRCPSAPGRDHASRFSAARPRQIGRQPAGRNQQCQQLLNTVSAPSEATWRRGVLGERGEVAEFAQRFGTLCRITGLQSPTRVENQRLNASDKITHVLLLKWISIQNAEGHTELSMKLRIRSALDLTVSR